MNVNVIVLISVLGTLSSVLIGFLGYSKVVKKDSKDDGKNSGVLMSDIGYIKSGIDDLKHKHEVSEVRHYALAERVAKVESKADSAHHRIDEIRKEGIV